jgi:phosphoribosyl 1,2-cyclic phosphodiesterase
VLDAGTGIQAFGRNFREKSDEPVKLHLFLTHTHWDHIQGLPFFQLAYDPRNEIHIVGPQREGSALLDCLERQMLPPNFPVPFSLLQGVKSVTEIASGDAIEVGDVTIHAAALKHPNDSMGYRIEYADQSLAYCLDHEHGGEEEIHPGVEALAKGADMLVFDAAYTDEEYPSFKGWGHSTWQEGYKTARALDVRILALAGFNPGVVDSDLDIIKAEVEALAGHTIIATEAWSIEL